MNTLLIDIETYSDIDLNKSGMYRYVESPNFEILLFGYTINASTSQVVDLKCGQTLPDPVTEMLLDPTTLKTAYNAQFERTCINKYLNISIPADQWYCLQAHALIMGLPGNLETVAQVLKLSQGKDTAGKNLIRYFSLPCKPTKTNGQRTRNLPEHDMDKWEQFKQYCKTDVEVEQLLYDKLLPYPVSEKERQLWILDQKINDTGIKVDRQLVYSAIHCDTVYQKKLLQEATRISNLENPNSVTQLKDWINNKGIQVESLSKDSVEEAITRTSDDNVKRMLELRQEMSRTSVKKYEAITRVMCEDGRVRGLLQYYGANRSGRWSSRLVQIQNLPRNEMKHLDEAREILKSGDYEMLEMLFDSVPDVLSQLVRTAFIPSPGCRYIIADFSAIEARCVAWLAGEQWAVEAFRNHGKIYEMTASRMFGIPFEKIVKGQPEYSYRFKGKTAVLACIAEGQQVLTDSGLVPIEKVTLDHRLWDGENWVKHEGVIYKGEGDVIDYDGLKATEDHLVWVKGTPKPIQFKDTVPSRAHLIRSNTRLYDILNAGPNHRFTVSGKLVHNCGYQGSVGALRAMGVLKEGLTEEELPEIVAAWRKANPNIVQLWWDVEAAALKAVRDETSIDMQYGLKFMYKKGMLFIRLPSGRSLAYVRPRIEIDERFNKNKITYEGNEQGTRKWGRLSTFGGRLVENIIQAIARDCLAQAMIRVDRAGYKIVFTCHDEVVIEMPEGQGSLEEVCRIISEPIDWAVGLPLRADGFASYYYKKEG